MKRYLITLCFLLSVSILRAATVVIGGGVSFTNLEPNYAYSYTAAITGLPGSAYGVALDWYLEGDNGSTVNYINTTQGNTTINNVQWGNTNSSTVKKLKVAGHYYNAGERFSVPQVEQTVTVKYIGPVGPLNIAGTNFSNGQTKTQDCGTSSISLSVPTVATDFVAPVTYYWTFPAGWSPASATTSTPSTSVTPSSGGTGPIKVEAKRNDGLTKTTISVNILRPTPSTPTLSTTEDNIRFCNTSTVAISASGNSLTDKFIWTPIGGGRINGSSSPQTILASSSANVGAVADGQFKVNGYSTVCGTTSAGDITRYVKYGTPPLSGANQYLFDAGSNTWLCSVNTVSGATAAWTLESGDASIGSPYFSVYASSVNGGTISVKLTNTCGSSSKQYFTLPAAGSGMLKAYPNPATDKVTLEFKSTEMSIFLPERVFLVSEASSTEVKSVQVQDVFNAKSFVDGNKIDMNVQDLKRGVYYLNVVPNSNSKQEPEKIRILLE